MIYVTGDTHGTNCFTKLININFTENDYLIICGDCGIVWHEKTLQQHINLYEKLGCTILFVDGNHENFAMLNNYPVSEYLGGKVHKISNKIYHLMRGEIFIIEGKTFFCFGGADSKDRSQRQENINWWEAERPTYDEFVYAQSNLAKLNNKVDYVITHTCDEKTLFYPIFRTIHAEVYPSNSLLSFIDEIDYSKWFFGHYHLDEEITEKKRCIYLDVISL